MRNQRIATLQNASTNYVDPIINKGSWQPPVPPKPNSNVVSDDAGAFKGETLLQKKTRRALERSRRRIAAGATVVGVRGGAVDKSAFN